MSLSSRCDLRISKIKHLGWSLLRKQITNGIRVKHQRWRHFAKAVNGWSPGQSFKLVLFEEIINVLNPCQTSRMKLFAKVANGWSLCQISQLELFGKIFNRLSPCQTSKMELVQKQLSDEVRVKHPNRIKPFVKIVNSNISNGAFHKNWWNSCQTSKMEVLRKYLTDGI